MTTGCAKFPMQRGILLLPHVTDSGEPDQEVRSTPPRAPSQSLGGAEESCVTWGQSYREQASIRTQQMALQLALKVVPQERHEETHFCPVNSGNSR